MTVATRLNCSRCQRDISAATAVYGICRLCLADAEAIDMTRTCTQCDMRFVSARHDSVCASCSFEADHQRGDTRMKARWRKISQTL